MPSLRYRLLIAILGGLLVTAAYGETHEVSFSTGSGFKTTKPATPDPADKELIKLAPEGSDVATITYKVTYTSSGKPTETQLQGDTAKARWTAEISKASIDSGTSLTLQSSTGKTITLPRDASSKSTGSSQDTSAPGAGELRVTGAARMHKPDDAAGLGDRIEVSVDNLTADSSCSSFVLCLDGLQIRGLKPECCRIEAGGKGKVEFVLRRTADSTEAWNQLLGAPTTDVKNVDLTLGKAEGKPAAGSAPPCLPPGAQPPYRC